ncbi:MAG: fatty acid cis/trans isomerase, partial [Gammaproteobacteria bacterium]
LVGRQPKTAWLIDYPTLERIHYLLVAGFDVFGSAAHQAMTRLYMDFLRMESEMNFLAFLPPETRSREIADWYRDAVDDVRDYVETYFDHDVIDPLMSYRSQDPKWELFETLRERVSAALEPDRYAIAATGLPDTLQNALNEIERIRGRPASLMPENTLVHLPRHGILSLLGDRGYTNISSMFDDSARRLVAEDAISVVNGVVGAYPNVFLEIEPDELPALAAAIAALDGEEDYAKLLDRYGVRRTSPRFWALSDEVHAHLRRTLGREAGLLDYNRLENR